MKTKVLSALLAGLMMFATLAVPTPAVAVDENFNCWLVSTDGNPVEIDDLIAVNIWVDKFDPLVDGYTLDVEWDPDKLAFVGGGWTGTGSSLNQTADECTNFVFPTWTATSDSTATFDVFYDVENCCPLFGEGQHPTVSGASEAGFIHFFTLETGEVTVTIDGTWLCNDEQHEGSIRYHNVDITIIDP